MPAIPDKGWVIFIERKLVQTRGIKIRTVGTYQIFHDGVEQTGPGMSGATAESRGPGANRPKDNGKRVEAGTYPLATQAGTKYVTYGYIDSTNSKLEPKPGIELLETDLRTEILIHPGVSFIASVGCINLCTSLPNKDENITFSSSRRRVITMIEDMKSFLGNDFPSVNGRKIPRAFCVIDGEP